MRSESPRRSWWRLASLAALLLAGCQRETLEIRVDAPADSDSQAVIAIRDSRGMLVRTLVSASAEPLVKWDGHDEAGHPVAPGAFAASVITHRGFEVKASGELGGFESMVAKTEVGAPVGVVADGKRVYLAWSGGLIAAVDLDGKVIWSAALPQLAHCAALAIDGGQLFALTRSRAPWTAQDSLVRLNAADGKIAAWPSGESLPILSLWPAASESKPAHAGALAARAGHLYLAFPELHFLSVLSSTSGEYLQTVIGPAPTAIDVVATRTESPNEPGTIIDADFAVIALGGGALGKVLFAHDPLWVIGSDAQRLDQDERITALTLLGDESPHLPRSIFVGLGVPLYQIQRREILDPQGYVWLAGASGGRTVRGPWHPDALGAVKALALDANGQLWVAEGDAVPPRFSVWNTEGNQGRLVKEFFGPMDEEDRGVAILPGEPDVVVAAGCEWRIAADGSAKCLGVITRDGMAGATFFTGSGRSLRLHIQRRDGGAEIFERHGEGDYELLPDAGIPMADLAQPALKNRSGVSMRIEPAPGRGWLVSTADGVQLGVANFPSAIAPNAAISGAVQAHDGRVFGAVAAHGVYRWEITELESIKTAPDQPLRVVEHRP